MKSPIHNMKISQPGLAGRSGFTLAELMIGVIIIVALLAMGLALIQLSQRGQGATALAEALATALAIQERFEMDLRHLARLTDCPVRFWTDNPSRLTFYTFDPVAPVDRAASIRAVRYVLDRPGTLLKREYNAREESVGSSPLTSIAFVPFTAPIGPVVRVTMAVGRDPTAPAGRPLVHSFLASIAQGSRLPPDRDLTLLSDFINPEDRPGGQKLP